jgi:hypothetical protein
MKEQYIAPRTESSQVVRERMTVERRQHTRYSIRVPVNFKWQDEGIIHVGSGLTRDISTSGMFVYSAVIPPEKADIELDISFPSAGNADTNLRMSSTALVLRVDCAANPGELNGFAVLNRSYALHNVGGRKTLAPRQEH